MGSVPSVARALEILQYLAHERDDASLSEMARALGVPKSTLHQIVTTLAERGYLERLAHPVRYRLGPRVMELAGTYLVRKDVVRDFYPVARELVSRCGETVQLAQLVGPEVLYLAKQDGTQPVRLVSHVGKRLPAHCTALGKAMLSVLPEAAVRRLFDGRPLQQRTPHTITSLERLLAELEATRLRGYAVDREETAPGTLCVAAPVMATDAELFAISIAFPAQRASPERIRELGALVAAAAGRVSGRFQPDWTQPPATGWVPSRNATQRGAGPGAALDGLEGGLQAAEVLAEANGPHVYGQA